MLKRSVWWLVAALMLASSGSAWAQKDQKDKNKSVKAPTAVSKAGPSAKMFPGPSGYQRSKEACNKDPGCAYDGPACGLNAQGQAVRCCCNYKAD